jgi:3-oxoadipate CoA-transferase beta subunit
MSCAGKNMTGTGCVARVYTDLAVIDVGKDGMVVREMVGGLTFAELQQLTAAPLTQGIVDV